MPQNPTVAQSPEQPSRLKPFDQLTAQQKWKRKKIAAQLGVPVDQVPDRRGRHGNQARGSKNGRWNSGRLLSSHGYVLVRVGTDHPMAFGNGYAYEHDLVMVAYLGRHLNAGEVVHHKNEDKTDNRIENLELMTASEHMTEHIEDRERDAMGRLLPYQ